MCCSRSNLPRVPGATQELSFRSKTAPTRGLNTQISHPGSAAQPGSAPDRDIVTEGHNQGRLKRQNTWAYDENTKGPYHEGLQEAQATLSVGAGLCVCNGQHVQYRSTLARVCRERRADGSTWDMERGEVQSAWYQKDEGL
eukprot:131734-Rhodomonas_salina.1